MSDIDGFERIKLMLARSGKEQSRAQRKNNYRDPARSVRFDREKNMQRDIDEVEVLLDQWAEWMKRPEQLTAGYPPEAAGGWIPSWCKDTEEAAEAADAETVSRVNACYDSLTAIYRDAINRHYKLGANVWRFARNVDFEEAKIVARVKFVQRGLL
jgi:hypothetical protein